jgi:transcription elongation factor Elf1
MNSNEENNNKEETPAGGKIKVCCPYCGSEAVFLVDPERQINKKVIYICYVCGQAFEHERKHF